jgi:2-C-methyl-D-erythritol 4-phosphate cytidylyltransferase
MNPLAARDSTVAVIPAAGRGQRLGLGQKAFLKLGPETLLQRAVRQLRPHVGRILVGVATDMVASAREDVGTDAEVHTGGATRQATIRALFDRSQEPLVLVLDANRPFVQPALIANVLASAWATGAAATFVRLQAPMVVVVDGMVSLLESNGPAGVTATPQAFRRDRLAAAFAHADREGVTDVSLSRLMSDAGIPVAAITGDERSFKITTEFDWTIARQLLDDERRTK